MMWTREDVMDYAKMHGYQQAADLLLLVGPDYYDGDDYDDLMMELEGSGA